MKKLSSLEKKLGVKFKNKDILKQALVHRSYLNEHPNFKLDQNERLEFLGDAVLELIVTEYLFKNYDNPEGELTAWRAALVNGKMLAKVAQKLNLEDYLLLSHGESKDSGRARKYILANALEAVIGAIYLDQTYKMAEKFVKKIVLSQLETILKSKLYIDAKSKFQEKSQEKAGITPEYRVLDETGPDHDKNFIVGVFLEDKLIAKGQGHSKQIAQQEAAKKGLGKNGWG